MVEPAAAIFDLDDKLLRIATHGNIKTRIAPLRMFDGVRQAFANCNLDIGQQLAGKAATPRKFDDVAPGATDRFTRLLITAAVGRVDVR